MFKDVVLNSRRIRSQKYTYLPDGIPEHIYSFPEEYKLKDCGKWIHYTSKNYPLFGNRYPSTQKWAVVTHIIMLICFPSCYGNQS